MAGGGNRCRCYKDINRKREKSRCNWGGNKDWITQGEGGMYVTKVVLKNIEKHYFISSLKINMIYMCVLVYIGKLSFELFICSFN